MTAVVAPEPIAALASHRADRAPLLVTVIGVLEREAAGAGAADELSPA